MGGFEPRPHLSLRSGEGTEGGEGYEVQSKASGDASCMDVDPVSPLGGGECNAAGEGGHGWGQRAGRRGKPCLSLSGLQCDLALEGFPVGPTGSETRECARSAGSAGARPSSRHRHCASLSGISPGAPNELHPINFFLSRSGSDTPHKDTQADGEKPRPANPILRELQQLEEKDARRRAGLGGYSSSQHTAPTVRHSNPILREIERMERTDKHRAVQAPQGFLGGAPFSKQYFMQPPSTGPGSRGMAGAGRSAAPSTSRETQKHDAGILDSAADPQSKPGMPCFERQSLPDASTSTAVPSRGWSGAQGMGPGAASNSNAILRELQRIERSEQRLGSHLTQVQSEGRVVLPKRKPDSPVGQGPADMDMDGFDTASSLAGASSGRGADVHQWNQTQIHYSQPIRPLRGAFSG